MFQIHAIRLSNLGFYPPSNAGVGVDSVNTDAAGTSNSGPKKTSRKGKEKEAQPKKRRGRPKKVVNVEDLVFEDEVIEAMRNSANNVWDVGQSCRQNNFSEGEEPQ